MLLQMLPSTGDLGSGHPWKGWGKEKGGKGKGKCGKGKGKCGKGKEKSRDWWSGDQHIQEEDQSSFASNCDRVGDQNDEPTDFCSGWRRCWGKGWGKGKAQESCSSNMFEYMLPHLCGGTVETMMASLPHVVPFLVQSASQWSDMLDKLAADRVDESLVVMKALRDGLEPFPQFYAAGEELDVLLAKSCTQGVGAAVASLLRVFSELPPEEQREIAPLAFGDVFEMLLQMLPSLMRNRSSGNGVAVICDGCEADVSQESRHRCTECADYDLCASCYTKKDELHPPHTFDRVTGDLGSGHPWKGWGKGKWGKGKGKWGKGKGKWGKGKDKSKDWWSGDQHIQEENQSSFASNSDQVDDQNDDPAEFCTVWGGDHWPAGDDGNTLCQQVNRRRDGKGWKAWVAENVDFSSDSSSTSLSSDGDNADSCSATTRRHATDTAQKPNRSAWKRTVKEANKRWKREVKEATRAYKHAQHDFKKHKKAEQSTHETVHVQTEQADTSAGADDSAKFEGNWVLMTASE